MMMRLTLMAIGLAVCANANADWNVRDMGALGDGVADDTAVFQAALDTAGAAGGGSVNVPAGHYLINGNLSIPAAVTLQGTFKVAPTGKQAGAPGEGGSILLATAGRGSQEGPPFINLAGDMATLAGFIITYPDWKQTEVPPVPYPPTVASRNTLNVGVYDCCFLGSYECIKLTLAHRHIVRNVNGYPSWRGLYVDECYDIGRIENIHFWPFGVTYDPKDPYCLWVNTNGVAFEFARTDWHYVINTFCFGYGVGYKFSKSASGQANGNFVGLGADCCRRAVLVEDCQPPGLLITNGEFVGRWTSEDSICIEIAESSAAGKVSLNNCSFWGPIDTVIWGRSKKTQLTVNACHFVEWDNSSNGSPAIKLDAGKAIIQGSTFGGGLSHIAVGADVASAIILGNQADGGLLVDNLAGARTQMVANAEDNLVWPDGGKLAYIVDIGAAGDGRFLRGWFGQESATDADGKPFDQRWSGAASKMVLPVEPNQSYEIVMEVNIRSDVADAANGLYLEDQRIVDLSQPVDGEARGGFQTGPDAKTVMLQLRTKTWIPNQVVPGSGDARSLGIQVRKVTLRAQSAADAPLFDATTGQMAK